MNRITNSDELEVRRKEILKRASENEVTVSVCCGTGCLAGGARDVFSAFEKELKTSDYTIKTGRSMTGCHGFCERGPLVVVRRNGSEIFYQRVKPDDVSEIVKKTVLKNHPVEGLLYTDPATNRKYVEERDVPFYKHQKRLLFGANGRIDPTNIEHYIAIGGYSSLSKALTTMSPEKVMDEVKKSGLRGRGGAGFATGRKWEICREASPQSIVNSQQNLWAVDSGLSTKYVICNADEGDPGAFMDRSLLEGNPHSVIEGMIIGAWAICGRSDCLAAGYIYVRNEYPLAVKNLEIALEQARESGLLGENILGSGFTFDIKICRGAGAFVCGEESAMLESIAGRVGKAKPRPPYPAKKGLFGRPTNINNVKTWASVPLIINNGGEWFSSIGTETSKGTMIFSLVGKINNTGLVEVPMGIKLRELIYDIGGGIPGGKKFKAVQTGGPSGGCLPEGLLDLPVDYEALKSAGSMMGSGGMIVMDEDTCMVEIARYFLAFTQDESCGKCAPCRVGTKQMLNILEKITKGLAESNDLDKLQDLADTIQKTALCGLGKTAPNPVLTTLKYFYDEYRAHIEDKKCPAKICKPLISFSIIADNCNGCHLCFKNCPVNAISGEPRKLHSINQEKCIKCNVCFDVCKFAAVEIR